ncbi:MAG: hypothetical protein HRF51_05820 [bacterium]
MCSLFWMRCRAMIFALSVVMLIAGEGTSVAQTVNPSSGLTYLTDDDDWDKLPPDPEPVFEPASEPEREEMSNAPAQWFLATRAGGILGFQINGDDHDGRFGFDFEILLRLSNSLALKGALLGTPSTITSQIGIGAAPPPPGYRLLNAETEHSLYRFLLSLQIYTSPPQFRPRTGYLYIQTGAGLAVEKLLQRTRYLIYDEEYNGTIRDSRGGIILDFGGGIGFFLTDRVALELAVSIDAPFIVGSDADYLQGAGDFPSTYYNRLGVSVFF